MAPLPTPFVSKVQASNHLRISASTVAKALDAGILAGPWVNGVHKVDSTSLSAALARSLADVADGDAVFHVRPLNPDPAHGSVRSHSGWHAQDSLLLPPQMRRRAWTGCWNMRNTAASLIGGHVAADVAGFIVDEAVVLDFELCPVDGLVNFIVSDVEADSARYLGRRIPVVPGPLWTRG